MLRRANTFVAVLSAFAFILGVSAAVTAQETPAKVKKPAAQDRTEGKVEVARTFRSGDLVGMNVRNKAGKDLGKIEDLVVELHSGDIRYAALSFGGFAGFGDKLFAVPWEAMTLKFGEDDRHFVFDVTQEELEKAPGFNEDTWPDVANPEWSASIDKHYRIERKKDKEKAADDSEKPAAAEKVEKVKDTAAPVVYDAVFRVSKLKGLSVRNPRGEDLGNIQEVVIDLNGGKIKYYALSFGGFAGFGSKLFAIPMHKLTLKHGAEETFFVSDMSPTRLKDAPGFDPDNWPDTANPKWSEEIDRFYGERSAEKRTTTRSK